MRMLKTHTIQALGRCRGERAAKTQQVQCLICSTGKWTVKLQKYALGMLEKRACASAAPMNTKSEPNEPEPNQSQVAPRESGASSITPALAALESHLNGVTSRQWA